MRRLCDIRHVTLPLENVKETLHIGAVTSQAGGEAMVSNKPLWNRLERLEFDQLDAAFPFTARLARDNGWSDGFAKRVVNEYRRDLGP